MCGIAGFVDTRGASPPETLAATAAEMADALSHRGPDDSGVWVDAASGTALGHRRLSIIDLSPAGRQPMVSAAGRYVITYNGEVYNFRHLSRALTAEGHRFAGHSDTEVLLAGIERWGLEKTLSRVNGMFAFALWDRRDRTLHLGRDRFGEKPLYYGWSGSTFLFGSELKALRAHPAFAGSVDRNALALYLRHICVPAPHSIFADVYKLRPGTTLTVSVGRGASTRDMRSAPYWSARDVVEAGTADPFQATPEELTGGLDHLLRDAVALRMQADVPLGAFLSGGIDSSTVVALMQAQSERRIKTFTIGFHEAAYDEARDAARVARHLGTDHLDLHVTPQDAMDVISRLPALYDEPFGDGSQIPTFLVSQLARQEVTVALSGDGGDELFAGYNRYAWCGPIWRKARWVPRRARRTVSSALARLSPGTWDSLFDRAAGALPSRLRVRNPGAKVQKLTSILPAGGIEEMYLQLVSHWKHPEDVVLGSKEAPSVLTERQQWPSLSDPIERMMYLDLVTYLPDDILTKLDRAAMGMSLESRIPLLDPRVLEFASRVPLSLKVRDGQGKWLLRQVLHRYVPPELVERPKMGFGLPIDQWLRGPLRDWTEELLSERRLRQEGLLDPAPIRAAWRRHLAGEGDYQGPLWGVLMFEAWLEESSGRLRSDARAR